MAFQKHPDAEKIEESLHDKGKASRLKREDDAKTRLQELVLEREERVNEAKAKLAEGLLDSAQVIVDCVKLPCSLTEEEARAHKLKLDAAKYNTKLHGLEIDIHELSGKDGAPLFQPLELSRGGL